jgi:ribonucleotide monophosphatase NagD (HAD superfamily)
VLPGCGPLLAAVETAAQRPADHVVGKPGADMLVLAAQTSGTTLDDWFVVGDSPAADLGMARAAGVPGVLVAHPEAAHADLAGVVRAWAA